MMEQKEAETSEAQPETSSSEEEEEEEEDEGFVGLTADQSDQGQGLAGEGEEEEEDDQDDEDDKEGAAAPKDAPTTNPFSRILSIWGATKYIGKWRTAHHIDRLTDSPARKALLTQHELDCQTVSLVCMMEAEAVKILLHVERGYRRKLGASHPRTKAVQRRIRTLSRRVAAKTRAAAKTRRRPEGWRGTLWRWGVALAAMLGLSGGGGHALPAGERPTGAKEPQ